MTKQTAPSGMIKDLRELIKFTVRAWLRREHLNRDCCTILVGDRGDGKSTTGASLVVRDNMMAGDPCASNMHIKSTILVPDSMANPFGLDGGEVVFESEELDKTALLSLSDKYKGYAIFVDETNIYMADARRAMSNSNLASSDLGQELRKLDASLTGTCIDEMFVDPRIRDAADNFIKCEDTALSPEGLKARKRPGQEIKWMVYPMSRKLCGYRYADLRRPLGPFYIPNKGMWGIIDTWQKQDRSHYKFKTPVAGALEATTEITRNPRTLEVEGEWGWLYDEIIKLKKQGHRIIRRDVLWDHLGLKERGLTEDKVGQQLREMGIESGPIMGEHRSYKIDQFRIDALPDEKVAVLA